MIPVPLNRGWPLLALLCLAAVTLPGCQNQQKKPTEEELQAELTTAKTDPSVLAPEWFRARYFIKGSAVENKLFICIMGLNGIPVLLLSIAALVWALGQDEGTIFVVGLGIVGLVAAVAALCGVGHFLINLVVGMVQADGEVPFRFSVFCTLFFLDLTLIFTGVSVLVAKARGVSFKISEDNSVKKWSRNAVLLAAGKAFCVSIVGAVASHVGGWIGGVIGVALLAGVAAFYNPNSK